MSGSGLPAVVRGGTWESSVLPPREVRTGLAGGGAGSQCWGPKRGSEPLNEICITEGKFRRWEGGVGCSFRLCWAVVCMSHFTTHQVPLSLGRLCSSLNVCEPLHASLDAWASLRCGGDRQNEGRFLCGWLSSFPYSFSALYELGSLSPSRCELLSLPPPCVPREMETLPCSMVWDLLLTG